MLGRNFATMFIDCLPILYAVLITLIFVFIIGIVGAFLVYLFVMILKQIEKLFGHEEDGNGTQNNKERNIFENRSCR
jgi:MFS superfamily sulfate permease-like transporter